jgi:hypothetical protein
MPMTDKSFYDLSKDEIIIILLDQCKVHSPNDFVEGIDEPICEIKGHFKAAKSNE